MIGFQKHNRHRIICGLTMMALAVTAMGAGKSLTALSPDGRVKFVTEVTPAGELNYSVYHDGVTMIQPSRLGIERRGVDLGKNVKLEKSSHTSVDIPYRLRAGKRLEARDRCEESTYTFSSADGSKFDLIVRVYDDGAAFRYTLHGEPGLRDTIEAELTEFSVPVTGRAWIHPYDWNERHKPSYEQYSHNNIRVNSLPGHDRGWAFPMLFQTGDSTCWMMVTEAYLDGTYPATHVDNSGRGGCYRIRFPEADEPVIPDDPRPVSEYPLSTPWRAVIVGDELNDIFATQMVQALNPPSVIEDESWIHPGRSAWSWWYDGRSASRYADQIKYVDFCREMGWEYSLIDAGWEEMDSEGVEGVAEYASKNGVGIWLWYHSGSGRGEDSKKQHRIMSDPTLRRAEMERISRLGVKGVKVDFFDTDKQAIIALYPAILKDAAEFGLMVDFHGATLPRGFDRTYPNLMTTEAIRGAETLGQPARCARAAEHNATVPFTRNVVGSMDYTPVTFSDKIRQGVPAARQTSMAHQLALAVVFESGFQCLADRAEAYLGLPEKPLNFLKEIPAAWDESRLLAGYPSDHAVIGRRKGDKWYLGGINGRNEERVITFSLPPECIGKSFTLITDGVDADTFGEKEIVRTDGLVSVKMLGNGGFAAVIERRASFGTNVNE